MPTAREDRCDGTGASSHSGTSVTVLTEEGHSLAARILDLSRSGVALEGTMTGVWVGAMVTVGGRRAKAVRMLPGGMALEFSIPIPAEDFDDGAVL